MIDAKKLEELEKELGPFLWALPRADEPLYNCFGSPSVDSEGNNIKVDPGVKSGPKKKRPSEHWGFYQLVGLYSKELTNMLVELNESAPEGFPSDSIATLIKIAVFPKEMLSTDDDKDILVRCITVWPDWTFRFMVSIRNSWSDISQYHQPELLLTCFAYSLDLTDNEVLSILMKHFYESYKSLSYHAFRDRRREIVKALGA